MGEWGCPPLPLPLPLPLPQPLELEPEPELELPHSLLRVRRTLRLWAPLAWPQCGGLHLPLAPLLALALALALVLAMQLLLLLLVGQESWALAGLRLGLLGLLP